jgi:hypothetical protein
MIIDIITEQMVINVCISVAVCSLAISLAAHVAADMLDSLARAFYRLTVRRSRQ